MLLKLHFVDSPQCLCAKSHVVLLLPVATQVCMYTLEATSNLMFDHADLREEKTLMIERYSLATRVRGLNQQHQHLCSIDVIIVRHMLSCK
jgi:hypothetical protein